LIGFSLGISNHFKIFSSKVFQTNQLYQFIIISFGHVTSYAITGNQHAIDSNTLNQKVSVFDGKTYTSLPDKYFTSSSQLLYQTNFTSLYSFSNSSFCGHFQITILVHGNFSFKKSSIFFSIDTLHI
jgi:hypothetical protein